jgi:hypothetical protein
MLKKSKTAKSAKNAYRKGDLWIAASSSLNRKTRLGGWEPPSVKPPESNRFLELADFALGLKTPEKRKRKRTA